MLDRSVKIYVAGHRGLVGSAIWNNLKQRGYDNLVGYSHEELDLLDSVAVKRFFDEERPGCCCAGCCSCRWNYGLICNIVQILFIRICRYNRM